MDECCITYIGLDVHKETIAVALQRGAGRDDEVCGALTDQHAWPRLSRLSVKLSRPGSVLRFCYEAGPCGYGIQRQLAAAGHDCEVVAPSPIPTQARAIGSRRIGAMRSCWRGCIAPRDLTTVRVPDAAHEAMRDLVRAREAAVRECRKRDSDSRVYCCAMASPMLPRARGRLMHLRWLARLQLEQPAQQIGFLEYLHRHHRGQPPAAIG